MTQGRPHICLTAVGSVLLGDGNFFKTSPFIAILATGDLQDEADLDQNGPVNFLDITPFISALSSQQIEGSRKKRADLFRLTSPAYLSVSLSSPAS